MSTLSKGGSNELSSKYLNSKGFKDIDDAVMESDIFMVFTENIAKFQSAKKLHKSHIKPLEQLEDDFSHVRPLYENFLLYMEAKRNGNQNSIQDLKKIIYRFCKDEGVKELDKLLENVSTTNEIDALIELLEKHFMYSSKFFPKVIETIKSNVDSFVLQDGVSSSEYGDLPSLRYFLQFFNEYTAQYKSHISSLPIHDDRDILLKVDLAQRLVEQKKNGYIKLPYYTSLLEEMHTKGRPGKVGQVVLKGKPGTGKTSVYSYKSVVEKRPYRIISMHQYINFYELMVQNTNLSPTKSTIDFINTIYDDYNNRSDQQLSEDLKVLFEDNKDKFPAHFSFDDFICQIFSIKQVGEDKNVDKDIDLSTPQKIKSYVLRSLQQWKDEKILGLLVNKKEAIKGEILNAIENGENVVLDEIDKIQTKEIEGILAFLDLNTGSYHQLQGMESDIFIPEWFGIYATSNDKHKPSGPLGRRFNSVYLNYLDKENLARYVAAKLVNPNLTHPFSTQELEQIIKAIEIIYQASTKDDYSLLDFSIRMIDNFINGFTKLRSNKRVEKLDASSNSSTYILAALKNAFSVQIEDVYGIKEIGSSAVDVGEQSTAIAEIIDTAIEDFSGKISTPKRLVKKSTDKQALFMKKIDPDNPVLAIIIEEIRKNSKNTYENPSIMHYGSQIGAAINDIDRPLQKQYNIDMLPFDIDDPIDELNLESENPFYKISMDKQDMSLDVHTNQERNTYVARNVYKNADSSEILIDSIQGWKFITIDNESKHDPIEVHKLYYYIEEIPYEVSNVIESKDFSINQCRFFGDNAVLDGKNENNRILFSKNEAIVFPADVKLKQLAGSGVFVVNSDTYLSIVKLFSFDNNMSDLEESIDDMTEMKKIDLKSLGYDGYTIDSYNFDSSCNYLFIDIIDSDGDKDTLTISL